MVQYYSLGKSFDKILAFSSILWYKYLIIDIAIVTVCNVMHMPRQRVNLIIDILGILSLRWQNSNYVIVELCDGPTYVQSEMVQRSRPIALPWPMVFFGRSSLFNLPKVQI